MNSFAPSLLVRILAALLIAGACANPALAQAPAREKLNIISIVTDDQAIWTSVEMVLQSPSNAARVEIELLGGAAANDWIWFDQVSLLD